MTVYVLLGGWVLLERNKGGGRTGFLPFFLICALSAFKCAIFLLDNATAITNLLSTCVGVVIALFFCKAFIEEKRSSSHLSSRTFAPPTPTPVDIKHLQYLKRQEEQAKDDERRRNELYWAARIQREREDADFQAREEAERIEAQRQARLAQVRRQQEEEAERRRQKEEADFERRQQAEAFQRRQREEEDNAAFQRRQRAEKEQIEKKKSPWF